MLARTFLRMCALEAVRPSALLPSVDNPSGGPWPTIAKDFVFDSRLDPLEKLAPEQFTPAIVVYTDNDNFDPIAQAGPVFYKSLVDLVFEISVVAKIRNGEDYVVGYAETDAELEGELDTLEQQIFFALHFGPTGSLFRTMTRMPLVDWHSHRTASSEEGARLAMRAVRTQVRVSDLAYDAVPVTTPVDLARLPAPLQAIAASLGDSTYLYKLALALARATPVMPNRVALKTVDMTATPLDAQGVDSGDDGNDIVASVKNIDA